MNKRFDRVCKDLAEEAFRLIVDVLKIGAPGDGVELHFLRAETSPPVVLPDYVASVVVSNGQAITLHIEFYLEYFAEIPKLMARYGASLALQHQRPVQSFVLLLKPERAPRLLPEVGECAIGETMVRHGFRILKTWEMDPAPILRSGNVRLFPWALIMDLAESEAWRIGAEVGRHGDEETIARFLTLGSLRYDRNRLVEMLEGRNMNLVEAILKGSSLVREEVEQGRAEGRVKGEAEGVRSALRIILQQRFPGMQLTPEIETTLSKPVLESLLTMALTSNDRSAMEAAIRSALN